jgi:peptide/nickel transport system permease protein
MSSATAEVESPSPGRLARSVAHVAAFFRTFPGAAVGAFLLVVFVGLALSSGAVHELAYQNHPAERLQPPAWQEGGSSAHLLGTDALGRDVAARIMVAIRISMTVAAVAVLVAGAIGIVVGIVAGYVGRWIDDVLMRSTDAMLAVPLVLFAIMVMTVLEPGIRSLILVIAVTQWMTYARVARAETLALKEQQYVTAARAIGARDLRILGRHILPQLLPSAIALLTLNVSVVVLLEAGLSFLGLGVQLPDPSLGSLLSEGRQYIFRATWLAIYPGVALLLLVLGINLLGDGLRAYLDPHSRR